MTKHWSNYLRGADENRPELPRPEVEAFDEQQWGQQRTLQFRTTGTGPSVQVAPQLIQATRPPRVWSLTVFFYVLGISDETLIHAPNGTITATFLVQAGLGQTTLTQYLVLRDTDIDTFVPDPSFPLKVATPIASLTEPNLPAKQVTVSVSVKYDRLIVGGPANLDLVVAAQVAPVFR